MLPDRYLVKIYTNEQSAEVANYARLKYNPSRKEPYRSFDPKDWSYHEVNAPNSEYFNIWMKPYDNLPIYEYEEWKKLLNPIPEKWYIVRNRENADVLNKWQNNTHNKGIRAAYIFSPSYIFSDKEYTSNRDAIKGYSEISFEDFKKYILKETTNNTTPEKMETKKIIGYILIKESPNAKEGTEFKLNNAFGRYESEGKNGNLAYFNTTTVESQPEWFSPIYEDEIFIVGNYISDEQRGVGRIDRIESNTVHLNSWSEHTFSNYFDKGSTVGRRVKKITKEEFDEAMKVVISGYPMEVNGNNVNFGCQYFSKEEIETYLKLLERSEAQATITIRGEDISINTLRKILVQLNKTK